MTGIVRLDVEEHGPADAPVLLLVSGLGAHRGWWHPHLVAALAQEHRVLLPDQRDCGGSPRLEDHAFDGQRAMAWLSGRRDVPPPYTLGDLARDHVAVLDRSGVDAAHVVGASMGGMVAQHLAFSHPDRVRSLVGVMTTTGEKSVSQPTPEASQALLTPPPLDDRDAFVEASLAVRTAYATPDGADGHTVTYLEDAFDLGPYPDGTLRQFVALVADGDRTERCRDIAAPTLVLHGTRDTLVPPAGGRALADAVPGARFVPVEGLGHDIPTSHAAELAAAIAAHVARVGAGD